MLGKLKTPSCPLHWVPSSRSKFGTWTIVPSLYGWNIAECEVKPQPTNNNPCSYYCDPPPTQKEKKPFTHSTVMELNLITVRQFGHVSCAVYIHDLHILSFSTVRQISTNGGNTTTVVSLSGRPNDIHSYSRTLSGKKAIVIFTLVH